MTILDPIHPVQSAILELLASKPGQTVADVHRKLAASGMEASVPNLYRTIGQMVEKQMLVKEKSHLSINFMWIAHVLQFAEMVERNYVHRNDPETTELPMIDGEKREFFAESLGALTPVWNHILAKIAGQSSDPIWYEYNSHPWHFLAMTDIERRLYDSLGRNGHKLYGNDTFLDRYGTSMSTLSCPVVHSDDVPFPKDGYSLWVCGDYVVDCVFPKTLSKHFAFFFRAVQSIDQFHPELFADIFRMKARCRLLVWKSSGEASLLRSKFRPFFPKGSSL